MIKIKTEWEVTPTDEHGDIVDIMFFSKRSEAIRQYDLIESCVQLWKVVLTAGTTHDDLPIWTDRKETLVFEK